MAHGGVTGFLVQACFMISSLWLVSSLEKHSLTDQPRLSSALVLLLSGVFTFVVTLASRWLPGPSIKNDDKPAQHEQALYLLQGHQRKRVLVIVVLVAMRVEIFQRVMYEIQCSGKGIEAFLPMLLAANEFVIYQAPRKTSTEPLDPWGSLWGDVRQWLKESPISLLASSWVISFGVLASMEFLPTSTYFCSTAIDHQPFVLLLQFTGVIADAAIVIMTREMLAPLGSTRSRLRALGSILFGAAGTTSILSLAVWLVSQPDPPDRGAFRGITAVYIKDMVGTSVLISAVLVSLLLWMFETGPLVPTGIATFLCGYLISFQHTLFISSHEQISPNQPVFITGILSIGFGTFLFTSKQRQIMRIPRILVLLILFAIFLFSLTFSLLSRNPFGRHSVDLLVYNNRVETDRWLRHATASDSLNSAIIEYRERHSGREPPPNFDKWYQFAIERKSLIIDKFDQIEKDILPFWGMEPQRIRDGFEVLKQLPDVGIITITNGWVSYDKGANDAEREWLKNMTDMMSSFAPWLPDMTFAVNLAARPKILTPWDDIHRYTEAGVQQRIATKYHALEQRSPPKASEPKIGNPMSGVHTFEEDEHGQLQSQNYISAKTFRRLQALACPPGSRTRIGLDEGARDLCNSCAHPHSKGQFLKDWEKSLDHCHQPDIFNLHEFYTIPHQSDLFQDLLPLFSISKTDSFNDILIPSPVDPESSISIDTKPFEQKVDLIYWQGDFSDAKLLTPKSHHGSHRNRLVHMVNNATAAEKVAFLVGWKTDDDQLLYHYEDVPLKDANGPLPFVISFTNKQSCTTEVCRLLETEFGSSGSTVAAANTAAENHRYTMILDTQDGPSSAFLPTLKSKSSVPVLSSIFREWYTERLMPWAHFIPIDLRYHGLHSTMSYFTGLAGRGPLNGEMRDMPGRPEDARWIAEEGGKWAEKALRNEDKEIYLFRLLLEWGRVISDDRNSLGFTLGS